MKKKNRMNKKKLTKVRRKTKIPATKVFTDKTKYKRNNKHKLNEF